MTEKKEWKEISLVFKEVLALELSPVAVRCTKEQEPEGQERKIRICRAIIDAAAGNRQQVCKENNACFGASWHLGFNKISDGKVRDMVRKFIVDGEKLFCSYEALDNLISQMGDLPDRAGYCYVLEPMEKAQDKPELVIFTCDPEQACRLLTLVTFLDGNMPKIKIGGPTCRMIIVYPLMTGETNVSFFDYTARKLCKVDKDKLLVSIAYDKIPKIAASIDICSGGKAKIEFPQEFREFLQKRLAGRNK